MKKMSSSFSMCFLPVVSDDVLMVGKRSKASDVKQVLSPAKNTMGSDDKDKDAAGNSFGRKNNELGRRSLSRFVNAVFFETSLKKKVRNRKQGQKLHRNYNGDRSESKSESKPKKISHPTINDSPCEDIDQSTSSISPKASSCLSKSSSSSSSLMTTSGRSSSSLSRSLITASGRSSSSLSSSSLMPASGPCNSRPALSETVGDNKKLEKSGHGSNIAFCCLLLTSLLVLVIWGKVCAIFCTSTVLVFANRWIKLVKQGPSVSDNVPVDVRRLPEIDLRLYRKKIIMEGLLERNHSRNRNVY